MQETAIFIKNERHVQVWTTHAHPSKCVDTLRPEEET